MTAKECYDAHLAASKKNVSKMKGLVDAHMHTMSSIGMITPAQARDAFIAALRSLPETTQAHLTKAKAEINGRIYAAGVSESLPVPLGMMRSRVHADIDAENSRWLSAKAKECQYSR